MDKYVDITSEKWTKRLKIYAWIRVTISWIWCIICCITLVVLCEGMAPYIKGDEIWEDMPFTLSQLEAIMSLLIFAYLMKKSSKVL